LIGADAAPARRGGGLFSLAAELLGGVLALYVERGGRALTAARFRRTPRGLRLGG